MKNEKGGIDVGVVAAITGIAFVVALVAAWLTHIITCLTEEAWGFLIAGAIMFPIGIIHGIGIWSGVW